MRNLKASLQVVTIIIACSTATAWAAVAAQQAPVQQATTQPAPGAKTQQLSHQEVLNYLLKADMAMQRNMYEQALDNYLIVAQYTHDPQVAQLATELAVQTQDASKALTAAQIWADAAPEDLQAQLIATTLLVSSNPDKASAYLNKAFDIKNPDIDEHLLLILNQLSPNGQKRFSELVYKLADERANDAYAQLSAAQIAAAQLDIDRAKKQIQLTLKLQPSLTSAIELNAKLIRYKAKDDTSALAYLDQQVQKYPNNGELRYFYISALLDTNLVAKAMPNLVILTKDKDFGGEAYITMGEIYIDQDKIPLATDTIKKALPFENSADKAKFYLGQIAEYNKDNVEAIKWYEGISENSEFQTQAFLRAAYLYASVGNYNDALDILDNANPDNFDDQKQLLLTEIDILVEANDLEKALTNCNKVLAAIPEDTDFLYARSVVYGLLKKPADAEKDLRSILTLDPNNANALNALGFTLSNQPARINEALPFLQKALSLNPDNPAYMDSMGWLMYKLGRSDEAISILNKAYKLSNDNEIAAHLGEVLWNSGKKDQAKAIWGKALLSQQDNQIIKDTLNRLQVPIADVQPTPTAIKAQPVKAKASN